jgi:nitrate/TMAO reductase-like tetraheme cytochrome c subunit
MNKNISQRILALILMVFSSLTWADGNMLPLRIPEKVVAECASCHMLYAPGFLPKESWLRIMGSLDKHYGVDASLDPQSVKEISQWLIQYSGTYKRVSGAPTNDRITEAAWFVKKHRKISEQTWKRASIKSKANCMACHTTADKGQYDDEFVKVPQ